MLKRRYRLLCSLYPPSESTEPDEYMAEVPSFPNCVAWGDTPEETITILESVVIATVLTYDERGYDLPPVSLPSRPMMPVLPNRTSSKFPFDL